MANPGSSVKHGEATKFAAYITYSQVENTATTRKFTFNLILRSTNTKSYSNTVSKNSLTWTRAASDVANTTGHCPSANTSIPKNATKDIAIGTSTLNWAKGKTELTKSITLTLHSTISGNNSVATVSVTLPPKDHYTVSFNANGGSGAPSAQTKWYGENLTLSSTRPTRTGYTFLGWSTSSTATSATYAAGGTYTTNGGATLYAVWKLNTYTVSYNANGGSGTIANQTKTHGVNLTLSNGSAFSRAPLYVLEKWNTNAAGTGTSYALGGTYTGNAALALYAVWKYKYTAPRITSLNAYRVANMNSTEPVDDGQYIRVEISYVAGILGDSSLESTLAIEIGGTTESTETITAASDSVVHTFGVYSKDFAYDINVSITDQYGSTTSRVVVPAAIYPIDLCGNNENVYMGVMHPYVSGQKLTTSDIYIDGDTMLMIDDNAGAGNKDGDLYQALVNAGLIS